MKKGFSLMELIVVVLVIMVISGGSLVYINNFNSRQKLEKAKNEVISSLRLAQSYAKTRQLPLGSAETRLSFVQVQIEGTNLVAVANGNNPVFFDKEIAESGEISLVLSTPRIYIEGGSGKLTNKDGVPLTEGETVTVTITLTASGERRQIIINSLGQIQNYD